MHPDCFGSRVTTLMPQDVLDQGLDAPDRRPQDRQAVIEAAVDEFRAHAFHQVTMQTVAQRAGLPIERVQAHFATFDDLVLVVVRAWYGERMAPIMPIAEESGAVRFLRAIVVANLADPGLMRLLSALVNVCATEDHPMAPVLQQNWMRFHALVQRTLARDVELGREPDTMEPARGAEQLIALYEGLQLQSMVRPAMNLLVAYDRGVTRLRDGWSQQYVPPLWEI